MRIKKTYQTAIKDGKVLNTKSNSQSDTYSCEYINRIDTDLYESKIPQACEIKVAARYTDSSVPAWSFGTIVNFRDSFTLGDYFELASNYGIRIKKDCFIFIYADLSINNDSQTPTDCAIAFNSTINGVFYSTYDRHRGGFQMFHGHCIYPVKAGEIIQLQYLNGDGNTHTYEILDNTHIGVICIGEI